MITYKGNPEHIYITLFNEGRQMFISQQNFPDGDTWYRCWPNKEVAESLPSVVAVWTVKKVNLPVGKTGSIYMRKPDELKHDPKEGEEEVKETPEATAPAEATATEPVAAE